MTGQTHSNEYERVADSVDATLSEELLELSLAERTARQEEVHGVLTTAVDETPELITESLQMLLFELNEIIAPSKKEAYLKSQTMPNSHVNTISFRLRFLRATLFDATLAAQKIVLFLDLASKLFGDVALQRPLSITDFSKSELKALRQGRLQFLPFSDRSGRRILVGFVDDIWQSFSENTKAKISLYMSWTAGNDIDTQRKGLVFVVWFFENATKIIRNRVRHKDLHTVRASAYHVCSPDTPFFRFHRAMNIMRSGKHVRSRLRAHIGTSMEIRYALQSYGIPMDQMPLSFSNKVKDTYMKQWIHVRGVIEEGFGGDPDIHTSSNNIFEYPNKNDVVFRPGSSCVSHPANAMFRSLIEQKLRARQLAAKTKAEKKIKRQKMISDIVKEIEAEGGRFLIWNDTGGWSRIIDESQVFTRIISLINEFQKTSRIGRVNHSSQSLNSATTTFLSDEPSNGFCVTQCCEEHK